MSLLITFRIHDTPRKTSILQQCHLCSSVYVFNVGVVFEQYSIEPEKELVRAKVSELASDPSPGMVLTDPREVVPGTGRSLPADIRGGGVHLEKRGYLLHI